MSVLQVTQILLEISRSIDATLVCTHCGQATLHLVHEFLVNQYFNTKFYHNGTEYSTQIPPFLLSNLQIEYMRLKRWNKSHISKARKRQTCLLDT